MQNANIFNLPENYTMKYCQCLLYPARERTRAQPSFLPFKSSKLTSSLLFISHPFSDCRSLPRPDVAPTFLRRRGDFNGKDCRLHSRKDVSLLSPFLPSSSTLSLETRPLLLRAQTSLGCTPLLHTHLTLNPTTSYRPSSSHFDL